MTLKSFTPDKDRECYCEHCMVCAPALPVLGVQVLHKLDTSFMCRSCIHNTGAGHQVEHVAHGEAEVDGPGGHGLRHGAADERHKVGRRGVWAALGVTR